MSVDSPETLPLLCELGWHRPEKLARWNDGYYFSKCARCGQDLVRTAYGSWQVPRGYRIVWQQKPPESRKDIALVPADGGHGENGHANGSDRRAEEPPRAQSAAPAAMDPVDRIAPQPEPEVARAAERQVEPAPAAEPEPVAAQPQEPDPEPVAEQPAEPVAPQLPEAEAAEVASPLVEEEAASTVAPAAEPEPEPEPADAAGEPEQAELGAEPGVVRAQHLFQELPSDVSNIPLAQPMAEVVDAPAALPEEETEPQLPIEELREEAPAPTEAEPVAPFIPEPIPAPSGRNELPIEEVLRHLHSTPLPPTPPEEPADEAAAAPEAAEIPIEELGSISEPEPEVATAAVQDDLPIGDADPAEAEAAPVLDDIEAPEQPQAVVAEPPAVEAPPPAGEAVPAPQDAPRRLAPIVPAWSDWDFMAEDEPDPIGTFWENPEATGAPLGADPEPGPAADAVAVEEADEAADIVEHPAPPPERQELEQPLPIPEQSTDYTPYFGGGESPVTVATRPEAVTRTPEPEAPAAWMAAPEAAHFGEAALLDRAEDSIPSFRMSAPPVPEPGSRSDPDEVPPWVDATDASEEEEQHRAARSSHFTLAAVASLVVVVSVVALSNRPGGTPSAEPQPSRTAAANQQPSAAPVAPKAKQAARTPAEAPRPWPMRAKSAEATRPAAEPFVSPGRPVMLGLPSLRGREVAFVSASVLQCRAAPVDSSPAVRKLLRGAEVQVLAREGKWVSVAHKGRQCWAARRFLSSVEPW